MKLFTLFITFFKIGLFTFGGGYAMLPLIQAEVAANGWLTQAELIDFVAVSESTPGPFAINIATYVGSETAGVAGSFFATLGVVLPSFIVILIVAHFFEKFKTNRVVRGLLFGLRPAAIGLIGTAVVTTAATVFFPSGYGDILAVVKSYEFIVSALIFVLCFVLVRKKVHPIIVIGISAVLGIASGYAPLLFK